MPLVLTYTDPKTLEKKFFKTSLVEKSEKTYNYEVSYHAIERGEDIADHHTRKPLELSVDVVLPAFEVYEFESDAPTFSKEVDPNSKKIVLGSSASVKLVQTTAREQFKRLKELADRSIIVDVAVDDEPIYSDMIITSLPLPEDVESGKNLNVAIKFNHIKRVTSRKVVVPKDVLKNLSTMEQKNANYGADSTTTDSPQDYLYDKALDKKSEDYVAKYKAQSPFYKKSVARGENIGFTSPVLGKISIQDQFGAFREGPNGRRSHHGIDIASNGNNNIYPISQGRISKIDYQGEGYGHYVEIQHGEFKNGKFIPNGFMSTYAHLAKNSVPKNLSVGSDVRPSSSIGVMGNSGKGSGTHLHLEIRDTKYNSTNTRAVNAPLEKNNNNARGFPIDPKDLINFGQPNVTRGSNEA